MPLGVFLYIPQLQSGAITWDAGEHPYFYAKKEGFALNKMKALVAKLVKANKADYA